MSIQRLNENVYIHEIVDIIGHNRERYTHHMTANWSPGAQERRNQMCFGVWNVLGSTGGWPKVLNLWEEKGWDGLAQSFSAETVGAGAQDEDLATWWAEASKFRTGGTDRIVVPAPWSPTITDIMESPPSAVAYAHETIKVRHHSAGDFLELVQSKLLGTYGAYGFELLAAFRTAMGQDDEAIVLWSIPSWDRWASFESDWCGTGKGVSPGVCLRDFEVLDHKRFLMTDSLLNPTRTGRQPSYADQRPFE